MERQEEFKIVRELAKQVAEIAALPCHAETKRLWKALNALKPERPMVYIDQICWNEMDVDGELKLRCTDSFLRGLESGLRMTLYRWKHLPADMVVEDFIRLPRAVSGMHFGIRPKQDIARQEGASIAGHRYYDQLTREEDLEKIQFPVIQEDRQATADREAMAQEVLDGILGVRMQGPVPQLAPWDRLAEWKSPEGILYDPADRPEFIHQIMTRFMKAYHLMLDQLEEQGLLPGEQDTIHCSGAFTDALPAPGYDPKKVRAKDLWTSGMAQIFSTVSPAMHDEFEIEYAIPFYKRFGQVYYGCCEPLDTKVDIVRRIPNVRKISMSPWVDVERGAANIGKDLVFSRKPSPAFLAVSSFDAAPVEEDLRATREACRRNGTPLEFILKDISTVKFEPRRLWQWAETAMKVALEG
ncbi:MAG TPA: hypothetical protein DD727_09895 [Clostridiales bacterium]|nr:hypothetical protein [Clostridiales bacterium]